MRFTKLPTITLFLMIWLAAIPPAVGGAKGGVNPAVRLTISDTPYLSSDGKGTYVDWRLESGDPCVFGWVKSDGFFFIYTNQGNNLGLDCEEQFYPAHRRYILTFPDAICTAWGLGSGCQIEAERIRADGLFGRRAQESTVAFMFYLNGISYSLDAVGDVSGSGDVRTLINATRTAQLTRIGQTKKPQPVGSPFVFPFEFTVQRAVP